MFDLLRILNADMGLSQNKLSGRRQIFECVFVVLGSCFVGIGVSIRPSLEKSPDLCFGCEILLSTFGLKVLLAELDDICWVFSDNFLAEFLKDLWELLWNLDLISTEDPHLANVCRVIPKILLQILSILKHIYLILIQVVGSHAHVLVFLGWCDMII